MPIQSIDDRNPAVVYSGDWHGAGSPQEFNSTTSFTGSAGSTAKITFQGTSIAVFGTIGPAVARVASPQSSYAIDALPVSVFKSSQNAGVHLSQRFYQSPVLSNGQHTLTITNMIDSDSFFLDFFLIASGDTVTTSTTPVLPGTASSTTSTRVSSPNGAPSPTTPLTTTITTGQSKTNSSATGTSSLQNGTMASSAAEDHRNNAAAIIGGVIGGLAVLALIIIGIIFLRRRQKREDLDAQISASSFWNRPTPLLTGNPMNMSEEPLNRGTNGVIRQPSVAASSSYNTRYQGSEYNPADAYAQSSYMESQAPPTAAYQPQRPTYSQPQPPYQQYQQAAGPSYANGPGRLPPDYPSNDFPSYGQAPAPPKPAGYALPSTLMNEYNRGQASGTSRPYQG